MSDGSGSEDDDEGGPRFKYHPSVKVKMKICIICENAYYASDCKKLKTIREIGKIFIICPNHPDIDLSKKVSDKALSEEAKVIIAQLKLQEKDRAQEEILEDISKSLVSYVDDKHNATIAGDLKEDSDVVLQGEIMLLKKLNVEMQDKNVILKDLVGLLKEKNMILEQKEQTTNNTAISKNTYSSVLKKDIIQVKHCPSIIVKAKAVKKNNKVHKKVVNKLKEDIIVPIDNVKEKNDGTVVIKCSKIEDTAKIESELSDKLGTDYIVYKDELKEARLRITNIDNDFNMEELEEDINQRNFEGTDCFCNVVHIYKNKENLQTAIITVSAETHRFLSDRNNRVHIGHQCCRAFDDLNINPCFNCGRVGHSGKKCTNDSTCLRCAGPHQVKNCDFRKKVKCANCDFRNKKLNTKHNTEHLMTDTDKCAYLKYHIANKINNTDYYVRPVVPKYLGFNGKVQRSDASTSESPSDSQHTPANKEENKQQKPNPKERDSRDRQRERDEDERKRQKKGAKIK